MGLSLSCRAERLADRAPDTQPARAVPMGNVRFANARHSTSTDSAVLMASVLKADRAPPAGIPAHGQRTCGRA